MAQEKIEAQARDVFWGLGEDFWKQIIDGEFHEFGPLVFDEGLHGGDKEPGFFESLKSGCNFASEHLKEKLSIDFYKQLHKKLCAHFKGKETNTEMDAKEIGMFRSDSTGCKPSIKNAFGNETMEHYFYSEIYKFSISPNLNLSVEEKNKRYRNIIDEWLFEAEFNSSGITRWLADWKSKLDGDKNISETISQKYQKSFEWVKEWRACWESKCVELNKYMQAISTELDIKQFVSVSIYTDVIKVNYLIDYPFLLEKIVKIFFDDYNNKIDGINKRIASCDNQDIIKIAVEEKIGVIADLFQRLEWLHPFKDGQGRTDLVLQAKLLSEEGAHPAILMKPYTSTTALLPEWQKYLIQGMKLWECTKASQLTISECHESLNLK
jgi:hypothetical protein